MGVNFGFDGRIPCVWIATSRGFLEVNHGSKNNAKTSAKSLLARAGLVKAYAYC